MDLWGRLKVKDEFESIVEILRISMVAALRPTWESLCTYCTYPYVSYVIARPTGFRQNIHTQYVRYVRYVRKYVRDVIRTSYDTYTYVFLGAHSYSYVLRTYFCTYLFVSYVFVRI